MRRLYQDVVRRKQVEQSIQQRVCAYLRKEYPWVIFRTDGGGLHLSKTQAIQYSRAQSGKGFPDLQILCPARGYHGLLLELKREDTAIYLTRGKSKGKLVNNEHIHNQAYVLTRLNHLGYLARFAVGYDRAVTIIDWYFNKKDNGTLF